MEKIENEYNIEWAKNQGYTIENVAKMYDFVDESVKQKINDALIDDLPE